MSQQAVSVVEAAAAGRVLKLILAEGAEMPSGQDLPYVVSAGEDMVNAAALLTLAQGGEVLLLPPGQMSHPMEAVLRY
ncbi:MAG: hypothetical protein FJW37_15340 [Acidobacteria bacterium]|nr:hypothetical protein [Acidobacteriota bacterium]